MIFFKAVFTEKKKDFESEEISILTALFSSL